MAIVPPARGRVKSLGSPGFPTALRLGATGPSGTVDRPVLTDNIGVSRTLFNRTRRVRAMRWRIQDVSASGPSADRCSRVGARPAIGVCRFKGTWRGVSVYVRITSRGRIAVVASGGRGAYDWHGRGVPRAGADGIRERRATEEPNGTCHIAIRTREVSICLARSTETRDVVRLP